MPVKWGAFTDGDRLYTALCGIRTVRNGPIDHREDSPHFIERKFLFDTNPWIKLPFIKHWLNLTFVTLFNWTKNSDSEMRLSKLASHFEQFSSRGVTANKQFDSWNMQIARKLARIIRSIYQARLVKLGPEVSRKFENFEIHERVIKNDISISMKL